jgi:Icc-related predicted phosphoesterase
MANNIKSYDLNQEDDSNIFKVLNTMIMNGTLFYNIQSFYANKKLIDENMTNFDASVADSFGNTLLGVTGLVNGWHQEALHEVCSFFNEDDLDITHRTNFIKMGLHMLKIKAKSDITHDNIKNFIENIKSESPHTTLFEGINNLQSVNDIIKMQNEAITAYSGNREAINKLIQKQGFLSFVGVGGDGLKKYIEKKEAKLSSDLDEMMQHVDNFFGVRDKDTFKSLCKSVAKPPIEIPTSTPVEGTATVSLGGYNKKKSKKRKNIKKNNKSKKNRRR